MKASAAVPLIPVARSRRVGMGVKQPMPSP
jgi:hypothetical protein